jgi:excisionase family DNA binding protein
MENDKLLNKDEARQALGGIGLTKFYQLLNEGDLEAVKIGKRLMIRRSEVDRYIASLPQYFASGAE